jgi:CHAT domain-containing protein/Tfp pilus assembly protein PilF
MRKIAPILALLVLVLAMLLILVADVGTVLAASQAPQGSQNPADQALGANPEPDKIARARALLDRGAYEQTLPDLVDAAASYGAAGNYHQQVKALVLMAYAYQSIGHYGEAQKSLESAMAIAQKGGNETEMAAILAGLGDLYGVAGQNEKAIEYLNRGLLMAEEKSDHALAASILNNLGNLHTKNNNYTEAIKAYEKSIERSQGMKETMLTTRALSNAALVSAKDGRNEKAKELLGRALVGVQSIEDSHEKILVLTNLGITGLVLYKQVVPEDRALVAHAQKTLENALIIAGQMKDPLGASYAGGYLARTYEEAGESEKALDLTRQAVFAAQTTSAPESLYLWQWQAGRLLKKMGKKPEATQSYKNSIITLQSIRGEMVTCYGSPSVSFRETVEPLYLEYVDLLLKQTTSDANIVASQQDLVEARLAIESLKAAELRDYFQDECVDAARSKVTRLDTISKMTIVVYPIVLPDRTEMLVNTPSGLKKFSIPVTADTLTKEVNAFRKMLEKSTTLEFMPHAQKLYDWLIRPMEKDLSGADTIVFVPDGPLRTIPIAALHDGKQFLIAKYATAITPGLDLTDPRPLKREKARVLLAGLTDGVQGFPPLPFVSSELKDIQGRYANSLLLNGGFRSASLEKELQNKAFSIVHIASHGNFSSDLNNTFLLTYDDKLTMDKLSQYIGLFRFRTEPLELLTLSACETAAGDERAALGLAGVTIRAGARSALATLWYINDEASSFLVAEFYKQLSKPSLSRAMALRDAQLKLMSNRSYEHPAFWSPFLLINNWL